MIIGTLINTQVYKTFLTLDILDMNDPCLYALLNANGTINDLAIYVYTSSVTVNFKNLFQSDNSFCTTFHSLLKW